MSAPARILCLAPSLPPYAESLGSQDLLFFHCSSENDFKDILRGSAPDLILSDFNLAGLGIEKTRSLLEQEGLDVPLIAVPDLAGEEEIARMLSSGASDCIASGQIIHLKFAIRREIANRLARQGLRERRMEEIRAVTARLAHDFNNVLAPVTMSAPMLKWDLEDAEFNDIVDTMEQSTRVGADMIRDLLVFGRGVELHRSGVSAEVLLREILEPAGRALRPNIRLEVLPEKNLPVFSADAERLKQVFLLLLDNAGEAMPSGGLIEIRAARAEEGEGIRFSILDQGEGIDPSALDKIFDPFFSTKRHLKKGAGLGLCIALGIVKSHGGKITAHNRPGKGSEFRIHLPLGKK